MNTRFLAILVTLAFLGFSVPAAADKCPDPPDGHRHCKPDDPPTPSATYTVELTGSVFHFDTVAATTDQKQAELFPPDNMALTFSRPTGDVDCDPDSAVAIDKAACVWDAVFAACENFFGPSPMIGTGPTPFPAIPPPSQFTAPAGNWEIGQSGGVGVAWWGIEFDEIGVSTEVSGSGPVHFTIWLILQGDTFFDNPQASFLPGPTKEVQYDIITASIGGGTVKGVRPKIGCVSGGRAPRTLLVDEERMVDEKSTLVIKATTE